MIWDIFFVKPAQQIFTYFYFKIDLQQLTCTIVLKTASDTDDKLKASKSLETGEPTDVFARYINNILIAFEIGFRVNYAKNNVILRVRRAMEDFKVFSLPFHFRFLQDFLMYMMALTTKNVNSLIKMTP